MTNGAHFTSGIVFTFGNVTLGTGQSVIIVKDATAFAAAWPGVAPAGVFSGGLNNSGDTLTLVDITGNLITTVTYSDSGAWSPLADGDGATLVLMRPDTVANANDGTLWRASVDPGGSPGGSDAITFPADADINADNDHDGFSALIEHALGTSDTEPSVAPVITASIDAAGILTVSVERRTGADDVFLEAITSSDLTVWTPATLVSDVPALTGRATRTWQCDTPLSHRAFVKVKASRLP